MRSSSGRSSSGSVHSDNGDEQDSMTTLKDLKVTAHHVEVHLDLEVVLQDEIPQEEEEEEEVQAPTMVTKIIDQTVVTHVWNQILYRLVQVQEDE